MMHNCQSSYSHKKLPRTWLMTDPRFGDGLLPAIQKLPIGSGVIFRHYDAPNRLSLYHRIAKICRRRGLMLITADNGLGPNMPTKMPNSAGHYFGRPHKASRPDKRRNHIILLGVHDAHEIQRAKHCRADAYLLSPIFATNSHKGQRPLGLLRYRELSQLCDKPVIALGGMNRARFQPMQGAHGYAAIDGLIG